MKVKSEHIRIIAITVVIMTGLFALFLYVSKKEPHQPPPQDITARPDITIKGKIERYGSNPDRDIDKLLLKSSDDEQWLHFPPNTAKDVLSAAHIGDVVEASANDKKKPAPDGIAQKELVSFTNTKTGRTLVVQHLPPPPPAEGKEVEISGNILDYIADGKGNTRSVIVDHWLVSLPPHARDALLPLLAKGKKVTVKGWERNTESGFVNEGNLSVVRPYAVVIDGTQYSIQ